MCVCAQVVGVDKTDSADHEAIHRMLNTHFETIRNNKIYESSYIRVIYEANMSYSTADYWARELDMNPRLAGGLDFARNYDKKGRVGSWTTHEKKIAFAKELAKTVPTMTFADHFITQADTEEVIINELCTQIRQFRTEIIVPKGDNGGVGQLHNKMVVTGKGAGQKDDLVMGLCIAIYHGMLDRYDYRFQAKMRALSKIV